MGWNPLTFPLMVRWLEHPLKDYYRFIYLAIDVMSLTNGLSFEEICTLRLAFVKGFVSMCDTSIYSKDAHRFYETKARLEGFSKMPFNKHVNGETGQQQLELMKRLADDFKDLL